MPAADFPEKAQNEVNELDVATAVQRVAGAAIETLPAVAQTPQARRDLAAYLERLLAHNRHVNLVSRRGTLGHVERFTRECAFLGQLLIQDSQRLQIESPRLLDLGSGGGFPGLALKTMLPHLDVTLVEATAKKARFLAGTCQSLDLQGITVLAARAESLSDRDSPQFRPEARHAFDWVTAKGLGTVAVCLRLAAPFLRVDGVLWTFKGTSLGDESRAAGRALRQLRFKPFRVDAIPGDDASYVASFRRLAQIDPGSR